MTIGELYNEFGPDKEILFLVNDGQTCKVKLHEIAGKVSYRVLGPGIGAHLGTSAYDLNKHEAIILEGLEW